MPSATVPVVDAAPEVRVSTRPSAPVTSAKARTWPPPAASSAALSRPSPFASSAKRMAVTCGGTESTVIDHGGEVAPFPASSST